VRWGWRSTARASSAWGRSRPSVGANAGRSMLRRRPRRCDSSPKRTRSKTQRFARRSRIRASRRRPLGKRCGRKGLRGATALTQHHGGGVKPDGLSLTQSDQSQTAKKDQGNRCHLLTIIKKRPTRERTRSRSQTLEHGRSHGQYWRRSRVGGKPVAITKPVIMTWGARKNISVWDRRRRPRRNSM